MSPSSTVESACVGVSQRQGKETAAKRWANYVSDDPQVGAVWRYLLVSEDDVETAQGSWAALKKLGAS